MALNLLKSTETFSEADQNLPLMAEVITCGGLRGCPL